MTKKLDWFKPRFYPHFDKHVSEEKAGLLVKTPQTVSKHAFMPFICFEAIEKRYKRQEHKVKPKVRPLSCSSHADSAIFSFYGKTLKDLYEKIIIDLGLNKSVIAYRKFPGGKCNIHFADETFENVKKRGDCVAIAIDVEKFFDTIDHKILKAMWQKTLMVEKLPDDHFSVFKAITKYSKVKREDLYKIFKIDKKKAAKFRGPFCTPKEFREMVVDTGFVVTNKDGIGIPQGSPISALLSNIYLLDVDKTIADEALKKSAIYRRYSDDVLLICDLADEDFFKKLIKDQFEKVKLKLSETKTQISRFKRNQNGIIAVDKTLQYLGFEFDGKRKLIRSKTISKYYRNMRMAVRATVLTAVKNKTESAPSIKLYKKTLYEHYSHVGKRNFVSYASKASRIMDDETIWNQAKKSWKKLNEYLQENLEEF